VTDTFGNMLAKLAGLLVKCRGEQLSEALELGLELKAEVLHCGLVSPVRSTDITRLLARALLSSEKPTDNWCRSERRTLTAASKAITC